MQNRFAPLLRAAGIPLFAAALVSMAAVDHPRTGWGVNTRLALVFAVVDEGRLAIDSYHLRPPTATFDKAVHGGHYYSDKIFGVSLLALPLYAAIRGLGFEPDFQLSNWALRVWAVSIPAAFSLVLLWALLVRAGGDAWRSLVAVAAVFWGSMWFGFSTAFFPYSTGVASSLLALWWILFPPGGRLAPRLAFGVGALCGFALLCDLTFGLLVAGLVVLFGWRVGADAGWLPALPGPAPAAPADREARRQGWAASLAAGGVGGILPLALFFAYTLHVFGELSIPYQYEVLPTFREEMARGFMGITAPRLGPLWFITFHPHRGLFFWTPVLALAAAGLVAAVRATGLARLYGALGLWALASYLTFNAGYYMWWGGYAMGPRFLLPAMAALPLGLLVACRPDARCAWRLLLVLGAVGVVLSLPISLLEPEIPVVDPYQTLRRASLSTSLRVPQLGFWKLFMSGAALRSPAGAFEPLRALSFATAIAAPVLGAWWARRRIGAVAA
jgi:hypothetical protein